jgi:hypothetical protein
MASPSINRQPYAYGDMFEDNAAGTNITITTAGTFYGWTTASLLLLHARIMPGLTM